MCCKQNPDSKKHYHSPFAGQKKGGIPWNKGVKTHIVPWNKGKHPKGFPHTEEIKRHLSNIAKLKGYGGYRKGSGRGIKGSYKGIWCDSSWELAFVIWCLDHNISIHRSNEIRTYFWKNKNRKYLPDFEIDGVIIEIKGYSSSQWEAKLKNNSDIVVLDKKQLTSVFEYVISKYGKKYTNLYGK